MRPKFATNTVCVCVPRRLQTRRWGCSDAVQSAYDECHHDIIIGIYKLYIFIVYCASIWITG